MVPLNDAEIVPSEFVAEIENEKFPVPVGVPVTVPVEVLNDIPAGKLPEAIA
jgi:hypothetical protein